MNRTCIVARLACAVALALIMGACGRKADVTGNWMVPVDFGPSAGVFGKSAETTLHIGLDIRAESDGLRAIMSREDENQPVVADRVEQRGDQLVVTFQRRKHRQIFELKLSDDGRELRGKLLCDTESYPIQMKKRAST
jgi:hypothetical protein